MSESGIVRSAKSDLPEVSNGKGSGKIAKSRKSRPSTPPIDESVDLGDVNTQPKSSLTDVAIAAADAELVNACNAFDNRHKENLLAFGKHITQRQEQTSKVLIGQIYGHFDLTESEIYDSED